MQTTALSQALVQAQVASIQIAIANSYRSFKAKQYSKESKRRIRISVPCDRVQVSFFCSFSEPPWKARKVLRYSLVTREMFIVVWMKSGDMFQLMKRGEVFLHPEFPTTMVSSTQDKTQGLVNLFLDNQTATISYLPLKHSYKLLTFITGAAFKGKTADHYEDAYFCTRNSAGLADGVSAWQPYGIDGGKFAEDLMHQCEHLHPAFDGTAIRKILTTTLSDAHSRVQSYGSSTVLLAHLLSNKLFITTLGDSRAVIVRWTDTRPAICFKSAITVHSFNTPFQLAKIPPELDSLPFIKDTASDALHYSLSIQEGDLLLMATDGLWDNLYDWEIIQVLGNVQWKTQESARYIAETLCEQAYIHSKSTQPTPFQQDAQEVCPNSQWRGGKPDDITVVAAWVG